MSEDKEFGPTDPRTIDLYLAFLAELRTLVMDGNVDGARVKHMAVCVLLDNGEVYNHDVHCHGYSDYVLMLGALEFSKQHMLEQYSRVAHQFMEQAGGTDKVWPPSREDLQRGYRHFSHLRRQLEEAAKKEPQPEESPE